MAGYSGTPLVKKLGIEEGFKVLLINAPPEYRALIAPVPAAVSFITAANSTTNFVHAFVTKRLELARLLRAFAGNCRMTRSFGFRGRRNPPRCRRRSRKTPSARPLCRWVLWMSKSAR
jgi:hypothetical protein